MESIRVNKIYYENHLALMDRMPPECIDLVVTSPPYGDLRECKGFSFDYQACAAGLWKVIKPGGVIVWVVGDQVIKGSESGESFRQALCFMEIGFNLYDTMIFKKKNYVPLNHKRYEQSFEYMFVLSNGPPKTFNPIMIDCKNPGKAEMFGDKRRVQHGKNHSMRKYKTTEFRKTKEKKIHPNIFEYKLFQSKTGHPAIFPKNWQPTT
jgi:site-specific DNA-methyltransferase (adenine-specific)